MNAPDSNHQTLVDGLVDVHGFPSAYSVQPLQFVPHGSRPTDSADVRVSGIDGLGVSGDGQIANPKPSKKRSSCFDDRSDVKKERFIWTNEADQCFIESYNRLSESKQFPKKITEDMRKAGFKITRENVASHLQKYRKKLKLEGGENTGGENRRRNRGRPSSKSVPPNEEINFQTFHNGTSNSTYPNPVQFFQQSHFISTNPNSHLPMERPSISTNPNSILPIQRSSISTNPNFHLPIERPSFSTNLSSHLPIERLSISTNPNSHFPMERPSISTNPNFYFPIERPSISTNPNSYFPIERPSISTNPNSHFPIERPSSSTNPDSYFPIERPSISTNPNSHFPIERPSSSTNPDSYFPIERPSISTNPNSHFPIERPSSSTNPDSYFPIERPSISTNPNSYIPLQSSSFSTSPSSQSHSFCSSLGSQSHSFSNSPSSQSHSFTTIPNSQPPLNESMANQLLSPFERTRLFDPNARQSSLSYFDTSICGEANNSDFYFGVTGQSSNAANNSNVFDMANQFNPYPIATNYQLVTNYDGYGNAIPDPTMAYSRFGDFSGNFDTSLGAVPNINSYNDGLNNMDVNLQFNFPLNSDVATDLEVNGLNQDLQSNLCPPGDNKFKGPFGNVPIWR